MATRKVLLLGWRLEAVTALHDLGAEVTCVLTASDDENRAGILDDAHAVPVDDLSSTESTLAALERHGVSILDFDIVCSQNEFALVNSAVLGGPLSPLCPKVTLRLRDKDLQKRRIREAGIPVADSQHILHPRELAQFPHPRGVLKPLASSGTKGVSPWHSPTERLDLAARLERSGRHGPWLAEQWVDGAELHIDGVVRDSKVLFTSVGRYLQNVLAVRTGEIVATVIQHPRHFPDLCARAHTMAQRSMDALGHRNGVFHLEVFEQGDTLIFGECGGRLPGGSFDEMIRLQHGVDLHSEWARSVLGLEPAITPSLAETWFGDVFLSPPAGTLHSCPTESEVARQDGVRYVSLRARPGDTLPNPTQASNGYAGTAVLEGRNPQHTAARIRQLAAWFSTKAVLSAT